jgi:hypothetical protein
VNAEAMSAEEHASQRSHPAPDSLLGLSNEFDAGEANFIRVADFNFYYGKNRPSTASTSRSLRAG